jgi:hypothetical protein
MTLWREPPVAVNEGEIVAASNEELHAAALSGKRLSALWNTLPGVEKRRKVGDRDALIDELWSAIEMLSDPEPQSNAKRTSKQHELIAMLRRPEGVTVDEVASVTGWQRHTVRGVFSGTLKPSPRPRRSVAGSTASSRPAHDAGSATKEAHQNLSSSRKGGVLMAEQVEQLAAPSSDSVTAVLALIERVALDPGADAAKLERIIAMHEQLKAKEAELAFNAAKGRILKKLAGITIVKNRPALYEIEKGRPQKGIYEAFKYAPLEEIDKHLRPLLMEEDLDLSYSSEPREHGGILIRGRLKHLPGGHFEDSFMPAPLDTSGGKSTVQGVGSTNSYLRHYIACNIFNIVVVGDDDDGNGGTIDEAETTTILDLIKKAKVGPKFLKYMRAQSIEEAGSLEATVATIAARDYRKAISTLEEQVAKAEASHANLS